MKTEIEQIEAKYKSDLDNINALTQEIISCKDSIRKLEVENNRIFSKKFVRLNKAISSSTLLSYTNRFLGAFTSRFFDISIRFLRSIRLIPANTKTFAEEFDEYESRINDNKLIINELEQDVIEREKEILKLQDDAKERDKEILKLQDDLGKISSQLDTTAQEKSEAVRPGPNEYESIVNDIVNDNESLINEPIITKFKQDAKERDKEILKLQDDLGKISSQLDTTGEKWIRTLPENIDMLSFKKDLGARIRRVDSDSDSDSDSDEEDEYFNDSINDSSVKISEPKQPIYKDVKFIQGSLKPTDANTIYIQVLGKSISFWLGQNGKILIPKKEVEMKLGITFDENQPENEFFIEKIPDIIQMATLFQRTKNEKEKEVRNLKTKEAKKSLQEQRRAPDVMTVLKKFGSSSDEGVKEEKSQPNKKLNEEIALDLRVFNIRDLGCKFINLPDEKSLRSADVMDSLMNKYAGSVIALVGNQLFDVSKSIAKGVSYKAKEISMREVEGHSDAIQKLINKINQLPLGGSRDAGDDLNLAIQVVTGQDLVKKQQEASISKMDLSENKILSPADESTIKGALMYLKSYSFIKTDLTVSTFKDGSQTVIAEQLPLLYSQIEEHLADPTKLDPKSKQALNNLNNALRRVYPETKVVTQAAVLELPQGQVVKRPALSFFAEIEKRNVDKSNSEIKNNAEIKNNGPK